MKTIVLFIFALLLCPLCVGQALPDAPTPQPTYTDYVVHNTPNTPAKQPGFFAFRGSWEDPPLRTNKQMFRSKTFILSQLGAATAMIIACRNPRSGEEWHSEVPAVIAVAGFSYVGGRFFTQSFAVAPGIYGVVHYSLAAAK